MHIVREIRRIHSDRIEIVVPQVFMGKEVEILVMPLDLVEKEVYQRKELHLTTYKCNGKKRDFTREDA